MQLQRKVTVQKFAVQKKVIVEKIAVQKKVSVQKFAVQQKIIIIQKKFSQLFNDERMLIYSLVIFLF